MPYVSVLYTRRILVTMHLLGMPKSHDILNKISRRCRLDTDLAERSLAAHLIIFATGTLLPMIAVAVLTSTFLAQRERARFYG